MLIQTVPVPRGTDAFEWTKQQLVKDLHDSIPKQYHLPESFAEDPPTDVTNVPRTCGIMSEDEIDITENYDATSLAQAIASKKLTAISVVTAFAKRAAIAQQLTCCLTQFFMDEAIERAKYLDDYLTKHGKPIGPLHGLPVSIKEHMAIAGHYSSYGYLSTRTYNKEDSLMISILRDAGAVFYVKTNQPQGIMHLESDGFMGRVNNPHNINLSAGGSTGGESALIAMCGSVLGMSNERVPRDRTTALTTCRNWYRHWRLHQRPIRLLRHLRLQAHYLHPNYERLPTSWLPCRAQCLVLHRSHGSLPARHGSLHARPEVFRPASPRSTDHPAAMGRHRHCRQEANQDRYHARRWRHNATASRAGGVAMGSV